MKFLTPSVLVELLRRVHPRRWVTKLPGRTVSAATTRIHLAGINPALPGVHLLEWLGGIRTTLQVISGILDLRAHSPGCQAFPNTIRQRSCLSRLISGPARLRKEKNDSLLGKDCFGRSGGVFLYVRRVQELDDDRSTHTFVHRLLSMDTTFPGNHGMRRALLRSLLQTLYYNGVLRTTNSSSRRSWREWRSANLSICGA